MRQLHVTRHQRPDLLVRPPCDGHEHEQGWAALVIDPIAQLNELTELHRRGVLTDDQFEEQKAKISHW